MLKVTKDGRVRLITEQDLDNHKSMGWSEVNEKVHTAKITKTKKSVEVEVHADVFEPADDDLTPNEEK